MDQNQGATTWAGLNLREPENDWRCKKCSKCGADIVLIKSKRTGKYYPVNFRGLIDVVVNDFHRCERRVPQSEYFIYKSIAAGLVHDPAPLGGEVDKLVKNYGQEKADIYYRLKKDVDRGITIVPIPDLSKELLG